MTQAAAQLETPAHIPSELVDPDFDFFALKAPDGDPPLAWKAVKDTHPPIFWTNQNGGHWVATRSDDIETIQLDHERFSMTEMALPKGRRGMKSPPIDLDPPEHFAYRAVISPAFSPKAVAAVEETIRTVLRGVIARIEPLGECEFVRDVAHVLPITVFLGMMGLPQEDADYLLPLSRLNTQAKELEVTQRTRAEMADYLRDKIEDRKINPRDDVLTKVVQGKVNGRDLNEVELRGMCTLLLAGGLDTVASMMGFIARFLATHPEHRRQLIAEPALIPRAIEELFRRHGISNTARLITHDFEFQGVWLKQGEMIQIPNCLFGIDPEKVEDPLTINFKREGVIPYAAFGNGPHRCPGIALARLEIRAFLEEWLPRIPDFQIKPGTRPQATIGMTHSMKELWLSWTPQARPI